LLPPSSSSLTLSPTLFFFNSSPYIFFNSSSFLNLSASISLASLFSSAILLSSSDVAEARRKKTQLLLFVHIYELACQKKVDVLQEALVEAIGVEDYAALGRPGPLFKYVLGPLP